jgi:CRISPR system Cascade subunit CasE
MYLSYLLIDVGDNPDRPRPGRLWLRNRYRVHQRLCMAFPSASRTSEDEHFLKPYKAEDFTSGQVHVPRASDAGFLFRIDPQSGGRAVILVQSAVNPNWDYAFHNARYLLAAPPEMRPFSLEATSGQEFRFRLVANPTRKIDTKTGPDGRRRNGKRVPVDSDQLEEWLICRSVPAGFYVGTDSLSVQPGYIYANKKRNGGGQRLRSVRYDGVLKVSDAGRFRQTVASGIGPGKAYGFGLLSVVPER